MTRRETMPRLSTPELDVVIEPADAMIVLAHDAEFPEIHRWERTASETDLTVLSTFLSVLEPDRRPHWNRRTGQGVVRAVPMEAFRDRGLDGGDRASRRIIRRSGRCLRTVAERSTERSDPV